jgi:plastocyanin
MSLFAAMGLLAVLAVAARAGGAPLQVTIDNFAFSPATLQVPVGGAVEWVNNDDIPHKVVADDHTTFSSKALDTGDHYAFTFTRAGVYSYFCAIHPKMVAKIIVK